MFHIIEVDNYKGGKRNENPKLSRFLSKGTNPHWCK